MTVSHDSINCLCAETGGTRPDIMHKLLIYCILRRPHLVFDAWGYIKISPKLNLNATMLLKFERNPHLKVASRKRFILDLGAGDTPE